eukprot:scaffold5282_cov144-Ochromonas_danica.AAC.1
MSFLIPGSEHSLVDFSKEFESFLVTRKLNYATRQDLVDMLGKFSLPCNSQHPMKLPFIRSHAGWKFMTPSLSMLRQVHEFGVCTNACVVYVG